MVQVRLSEWTHQQLTDIKEEEDHSSLDSVVKSLLKGRDDDG